jgi:flagellar biosynthesis GTPase FlhF
VRQLHVVALSEDGRSVLLGTSKSAKTGGFSLALDARLAAALRGDLPRPGEQQVRETGVSPKEIQARLRAGESPEQIANAAGVPVARVERFAGPVLSERERIIEEARAAYVSRNRRGASLLPLGDAVDAALAETSSLRPDSVTWTARRLESGHWLVQVAYIARARARTAAWVYEPHTRAITASDTASAALGHVSDDAAPRRTKEAVTRRKGAVKARPRPKAKAAPTAKPTKKAPARKVSAKKAPAKKAPAKKAAANKVTAKRAPAKKAAAKKATTNKAVTKKTTAKKVTARKARPTARKKVAPAVKWGAPVEPTTGPPTLRVVPPAQEEPTAVPAAKRRAAGERAQVPDWADVLLGAAPHRKGTDA